MYISVQIIVQRKVTNRIIEKKEKHRKTQKCFKTRFPQYKTKTNKKFTNKTNQFAFETNIN
jgi:hypothetical protein